MMKRLLFTFLFATSGVIGYAQCTPDVSCVAAGKTYGVCPDSAVGLKEGVVNVPYSETVSLMIPKDGTDFGAPIPITNIQLISVTGLAPGLSYTCSAVDCKFPGNSTGCALISGTPTQVWNQPLVVKVRATLSIGGSIDRDLTGYSSIVTAPTGIESFNQTKFEVAQNAPNPFNGKSEIHFNAVSNTNIDFKVYNMLGAVVYSNSFRAEKGQNTITLEASSFAPGVYVYSVATASQTITKRMIVSK